MLRARHRFLAFLGFLLLFPFFLRRRPRVERRITIFASPEIIFALLEDPENWSRWTELSSGKCCGNAGALHPQDAEGMRAPVRVMGRVPASRLDYEMAITPFEASIEYPLRARFDLLRDGECTRLVWRAVWEQARNPYLRYVDLFFQWMLGRHFSRGLANLKRLAERQARNREREAASPIRP
ncbi:MAG: SRPBCC family protein [Verrucomicrobiota bacterium]